ncbi:hypothetical protein [Polaribacter sp. Hel_I_88]|uniref:hypothetical protein n=1 Tax=Polaribacter sp. Hel_I_88 TaxID=1250006 RepID=UPI00047C58AF|nr:hypothetical protein [Polaribacter sp. Hel_I_88]
MKTNKLDNSIKEKFANRTLEPSASAWERLSVKLDEEPKQKKIGWFFYIGVAASILLLVSVSMYVFSDTSQEIIFEDDVVIEKIDKDLIDKNIENIKTELPIEEVIVQKDGIKVTPETSIKKIIDKKDILKEYRNSTKIKVTKATKNENVGIANVDKISTELIEKEGFNEPEILKRDPNSSIKINAEDLLFAVTHSQKEVKAYYAKYNVEREDVLKTIKSELKKTNFKIDPNTILAEVERTIDDDVFQNNFMNSLKRKVSDIAEAIASRND